MSEEKIPFLKMFPFCEDYHDMCGGLRDAAVVFATVNKEKLTMSIDAEFRRPTIAAERHTIEGRIAAQYGLASVVINDKSGRPAPAAKPKKKDAGPAAAPVPKEAPVPGDLIYGKGIRGEIVKMSELSAESGPVVVRGEVYMVENRDIQKTGAWVLCIEMTDYTGSIRVTGYFKKPEDKEALSRIKKGMYLTVYGVCAYNRYDEDIVIEPKSVQLAQKPTRKDKAPEGEKRVELHLHTRYSTLDALTDPTDAVKRAAKWGHRAIAITDHGVAQAFPEMWHAGEKAGIKIVYGVEGYYLNDVDDKLVFYGEPNAPLDQEFCAFDTETTGLSANDDRMTEIGAVIMKGSEVLARFQTFVNPERHIPPDITELTGITDRDVFDAPSEGEAMQKFLEFAGDRPLVAHNAEFDIGFLHATACRCGIDFDPVFFDTLTLSQALLPDMKRFKLDLVTDRLGLPTFNHHRADDDALACGRIMAKLLDMLRERGITQQSEIEAYTRAERNAHPRPQRLKHIIFLVRNKVGLKNLYEIVSKSHLEHFKKNPIVPKSLLLQYREGIIVGSACEAGEIFDAVARKKSDEELERLCGLYDYLEIQPICNNAFMLENGSAKNDEDLRDFNRRIVALGEKFGKPVVATGDVHFLDPEQEVYRRILLAGRGFQDADRPMPLYFKTTDEMLDEFAYLGEDKCREVVVTNPNAIADECENIVLLPKDLYPPKIENSAEDLKNLVYDKMHELYGENPDPRITKRIEEEFYGDNPPDENGNIDPEKKSGILGRGYDVIYMSAQKLVKDSNDHGYLVGSRGSVGSSLVAYMSGITEVNALPPHYLCPKCKHCEFEEGTEYGCGADMPDKDCPDCGTKMKKEGFNIPFETFLGFGGDKVPDIDLNFSGEYQGRAHQYTRELFGRDHVFKAGTIGTLAEKTAYGYVKNYLNEREIKVTKAEENRLAQGCVGVKRTTGQHPGGLVVIPQDMDVTDFCPVQHPADDPDSDIITTHFEYHSMEANLLKLDELGHDDPTMIRMLEDATGVDARQIPLDDHDTMSIFKSPKVLGLPDDDPVIGKTGTIGIPEFGTNFTRQMLVDTQPDKFATLVRLSGFSHGTDVWNGNIHDLVVNKVADVNDCVGCRDDIMLYLMDRGIEPKRAFKFMEAVRKNFIRKGKPWPEGIVEEMQEHGVPEWYIESCRKIQYLFPKAHAVAYVTMAFRIAYFKVHYPLAYYSCYFYRRSQKDAFDAALMTRGIEPVRRKIREINEDPKPSAKDSDTLTTLEAVYEFYMRGFSFAKMDIYKSHAIKFEIEGKTLIPPFVAIAGLGETAANDLMAARESKDHFISIEELSAACPKVSTAHLQQLKELGALGDMPETSQMSLF